MQRATLPHPAPSTSWSRPSLWRPPASMQRRHNTAEPFRLQRPARQLPTSNRTAATEAGGAEGLQNPLFNSAFASVLQGALQRQGEDALFKGQKEKPKEKRSTASEEVLQTALQASRQNLRGLKAIQQEVGSAIAREQKQFERLHFALTKVHSDGAYLNTIEELLEEAQLAEEVHKLSDRQSV